ncbi:MAG: hypothetical protein NTX92_07205 [Euryarchaeota archaeon]|nr:hypothetical protein [Euryarchaeota archaeon]
MKVDPMTQKQEIESLKKQIKSLEKFIVESSKKLIDTIHVNVQQANELSAANSRYHETQMRLNVNYELRIENLEKRVKALTGNTVSKNETEKKIDDTKQQDPSQHLSYQ